MRFKSRDIWYTLALLVTVGAAAIAILSFTDLSPQEPIAEASETPDPRIGRELNQDVINQALEFYRLLWEEVAGQPLFIYQEVPDEIPEGPARDCLKRATWIFKRLSWDSPLEEQYPIILQATDILEECLEEREN